MNYSNVILILVKLSVVMMVVKMIQNKLLLALAQ